MKKRLYKRKRTTLGKMFAKAMIIPILLTLMFAALLNVSIEYKACSDAEEHFENVIENIEHTIQFSNDENDKFGGAKNHALMSMGMTANVDMFNFQSSKFEYFDYVSAKNDRDSLVVSAVVDENGNIMLSNSVKMWCVFRSNDDPSQPKWFYCDPQEVKLPDLDKLIDDHIEAYYTGKDKWSRFDITGGYFNFKEHKMIPYKIQLQKGNADDLKTKDIVINTDGADLSGYEYMEFAADNFNSGKREYPCCTFEEIWGVEQEKIDKALSEHLTMSNYGKNYESDYEYAINDFISHSHVNIDGKKYTLFVELKVNVWVNWVKKLYCTIVLLFFLIVTLLIFLRCWAKSVKNKAQYAFEDYQRALTNNLAHDIKTPLAVIGGYAENLIEMRKESADEKELNYLSSIMDNVAYTDNIVARTLQLSQTEQLKKPNKKKVDIKALAENLSAKYRTALEERDIDLKIEGGAVVNADEELLSVAVENLISNAVKYTRDGGTINMNADKKRFNIVNDVVENIDTKDLLMPFVKGDKARSDKGSSGLGLAIASAATVQNGFSLQVECKDKKFRAMIEY
ncbi:MAG: HAMP domain-containing histidine kinase [Ruminococcus sp.]|uniref:sensor histidine kinase n=1 Tax=Ruminococcus sp. TaxID=41978 RepID=UPI0025D8057D|nr:HAMP domain-containing sensor histidine kinase [Ruminococcus sp.]MCR5600702.1 HAMP domain-containing histidine kinase [Ruminococcus sp.]